MNSNLIWKRLSNYAVLYHNSLIDKCWTCTLNKVVNQTIQFTQQLVYLWLHDIEIKNWGQTRKVAWTYQPKLMMFYSLMFYDTPKVCTNRESISVQHFLTSDLKDLKYRIHMLLNYLYIFKLPIHFSNNINIYFK